MKFLPKAVNSVQELNATIFVLSEQARILEGAIGDVKKCMVDPTATIPPQEYAEMIPDLQEQLEDLQAELAYYQNLRASGKIV